MSDNRDTLISNFCAVTSCNLEQARHFLEASNWNLENAMSQYYESIDEDVADVYEDGGQDDELYTDPAARPSASTPSSSTPSGSSQPKPKYKPKSRIATLGDLRRSGEEDEEDEDERNKQDLFTGGEKSGLAVQNPGEVSSGRSLINDILKRATEDGQRRREEEPRATQTPRFTGTGHTLGSEDSESVTVPGFDPIPASRPSVTRSLTFWRDGFSVEDGPLMRYDDPANREILQAIESGRAPLDLINVEPGQPVDVNVHKRLDENYIPPKKKFVPFSGQGQRLGSLIPGDVAPSPVTPLSAATTSTHPIPTVDIDPSAPTTNLQIRLGDGTRLVSRFNHTHTVGDLYAFVNASSVASRSRGYILQMTFPNRELKEMGQSLKEAGLVNAVVVQKWIG